MATEGEAKIKIVDNGGILSMFAKFTSALESVNNMVKMTNVVLNQFGKRTTATDDKIGIFSSTVNQTTQNVQKFNQLSGPFALAFKIISLTIANSHINSDRQHTLHTIRLNKSYHYKFHNTLLIKFFILIKLIIFIFIVPYVVIIQ